MTRLSFKTAKDGVVWVFFFLYSNNTVAQLSEKDSSWKGWHTVGHLTDQDYTRVWKNQVAGSGWEINNTFEIIYIKTKTSFQGLEGTMRYQHRSNPWRTGLLHPSCSEHIHNATWGRSLSPWRKPTLWVIRCPALTCITLSSSSVRHIWSKRTDLPGVLCYGVNKTPKILCRVGCRGFVRKAFRKVI